MLLHNGNGPGGILLGDPLDKVIIVKLGFLVEADVELDELLRCLLLVGHGRSN